MGQTARSFLALGAALTVGWSLGCDASRPASSQADAPVATQSDGADSPAGEPPGRPAPEPSDEGFLGVMLADSAVDVAAQVEGRIESVAVRLGDSVRGRDPLAVIRVEVEASTLAEAEAALAEARSQLHRAEIKLTQAEERHVRQKELGALSSREDVRQSELERQVAASELQAVRARVAQLESRLEQVRVRVAESTVRAPFAGEVAARYVEPGAWVTPGTPIVRVVGSQALRVRFAVPAERRAEVEVGLKVAFHAENQSQAVVGEVRHIAPEIDSASQMIFAEAAIEGPTSGARPGEVGRIRPLAHGR